MENNRSDDRSEIYKTALDLKEENDVRIIAYDYIAEKSTILDVGCACGDFGKLLYTKNCNVYGMEYDVGSIKIASGTHAYKMIHQIDLNDFNENEYENYINYFDSITVLDILEHLLEPEQVLSYLTKLLKVDGNLIVSLPNISFCDIKVGLLNNDFTYTDTGILDRTHIKFYTHKSIADMMTHLNIEIYDCKPKVAYFSQNSINLPASIIRYIEKDPHSFIYQYVLHVKPSSKSRVELEKINRKMTDLSWDRISLELNQLKKRRWIQIVFPQGSLQNKMARKLKNSFMGRK